MQLAPRGLVPKASHQDRNVYRLSNEKRAPGCLGDLLGMKFPTQLYWDYFINHEIRIPIKQPVKWNVNRVLKCVQMCTVYERYFWWEGVTGKASVSCGILGKQ